MDGKHTHLHHWQTSLEEFKWNIFHPNLPFFFNKKHRLQLKPLWLMVYIYISFYFNPLTAGFQILTCCAQQKQKEQISQAWIHRRCCKTTEGQSLILLFFFTTFRIVESNNWNPFSRIDWLHSAVRSNQSKHVTQMSHLYKLFYY